MSVFREKRAIGGVGLGTVVVFFSAVFLSAMFLSALLGVAFISQSPTAMASPALAAQDSDVLDSIRAEFPEGDPGKFDLTEADARFGTLVSLYGQSTAVANFGEGSTLTGPCGGWASSYDQSGKLIDAAMDAGDGSPPVDLFDFTQAFTSGNPFKVDPRGIVTYYGFSPRTGDGPMNHKWFIKSSGISLDKGGDPNDNGNNRNKGAVDLDKDLPVKFSAKIKVEGEMKSANLATCFGQGHVDVQGDGLTDPVGIAGLALLGGGLLGLLFNARPATTWKVG